MRRASGLDAQFLYAETSATPMHTLKIAIANPPESGPLDIDQIRQRFAASLHRLPPFHWQVLPTPLGLHHPMWIDQPDFDLDYHVRRMAAPAPGGDRELCDVISEIAAWPLDRNRPLWQLYVIDGLAGGRVATVAKVHHAIADGVSSAELLMNYLSTEPIDASLGPAELARDPVPSWLSLLWMAVRDQLRHIFVRLPQLLRAIRLARRKRQEPQAHTAGQVPSLYSGPPTPWNKPLTPYRSFAFFTVPLAEARSVASAFDVKVNDVFLSSVAGGLRAYLLEKDALPDKPLVGGMPASTRTEELRHMWGNCLVALAVPLRTDIEDPIERLHATIEGTRAVKHDLAISKGARPEEWLELYPPFFLKLVNKLGAGVIKAGGPAVHNLIVSNVPGPGEQLYHNRTPIENFVSVGPPIEGVGLNITVWSYLQNLNYSFLACRDLIPDLWHLAEQVRDSFDELKQAAEHEHLRSA